MVDPKLGNLQEIMRFLAKILVKFESVCFNNDQVTTQHTTQCVKNCSDN